MNDTPARNELPVEALSRFLGEPPPAPTPSPEGSRTRPRVDPVSFLRHPNHQLWRVARALRAGTLVAGMRAEVDEWLNGHFDPESHEPRGAFDVLTDDCSRSLLEANFFLVFACQVAGTEKHSEYLTKAGECYDRLLRVYVPDLPTDGQCGRAIAQRTFDRLAAPYPEGKYRGDPAFTRVLTGAPMGNGSTHMLHAECDHGSDHPPAPYFDPIRIGVADITGLLRDSVGRAWRAFTHDRRDQRPTWWGWLEVEHPWVPRLDGPSAGAAFWTAFRAAHEGTVLDRTVAVSAELVEQNNRWGLKGVGFQNGKISAASVKGVTTVVLGGQPGTA